MSVTFADAAETVRRPCLGGESSPFVPARPEPAETGSLPRVARRAAERRENAAGGLFQRHTNTRERTTSQVTRQLFLAGLYLILDPAVRSDRPLTDFLREAACHGVRLFQYRDKGATMKDAYVCARALQQAAREVGALLIVNDRCDLAMAVDADGVHLGQEDLPITYARRLLGPDKIIGLSTHTVAQVREAVSGQPDYIGFGPIFSTSTKADPDPVVGLKGLREVRALTSLPMFAIGGITVESSRDVMAAGANGVAVISAILKAPDFGSAIRSFQQSLATPARPNP